MPSAILAEVTSTRKHFFTKRWTVQVDGWVHRDGVGRAADLEGKCEDHLLMNSPAYNRHWKPPKNFGKDYQVTAVLTRKAS